MPMGQVPIRMSILTMVFTDAFISRFLPFNKLH